MARRFRYAFPLPLTILKVTCRDVSRRSGMATTLESTRLAPNPIRIQNSCLHPRLTVTQSTPSCRREQSIRGWTSTSACAAFTGAHPPPLRFQPFGSNPVPSWRQSPREAPCRAAVKPGRSRGERRSRDFAYYTCGAPYGCRHSQFALFSIGIA